MSSVTLDSEQGLTYTASAADCCKLAQLWWNDLACFLHRSLVAQSLPPACMGLMPCC